MNKIKLSDWPFDKEDRAVLLDISKPFQSSGKWFINAQFYCSEKETSRRIKCELGSLILLKLNGIYEDGHYVNSQNTRLAEIMIDPDSTEIRLIESKYSNAFDKYNMSVYYNNQLYVFPLIEVMKTILAPDTFCLNFIAHFDSYEQYFTYSFRNRELDFNFTPEVNINYLTNEKLNHLAWLITNKEAMRMISELYLSLHKNSEIFFNYYLKGISVKALVAERKTACFVSEILEVRGKRLNAGTINVSHPKLINEQESNKSKKYISITFSDKDNPVEIDADVNASSKTLDMSIVQPITSTYINHVLIKRIKLSKEQASIIDDTTKTIYRVSNKRSSAEAGGQNTVTKLEFMNLNNLENFSSFERIVMVLREIELLDEVRSVDCKIGILSEYRKWGAFITLDDLDTNRKYLVSQIFMNDERKAILLEIENGKRALSTLLLVCSNAMNTSLIADNIIKGTIKRSGSWDYEIISDLSDKYNFSVNKFRHTNVSIEKLVERILYKLGGNK